MHTIHAMRLFHDIHVCYSISINANITKKSKPIILEVYSVEVVDMGVVCVMVVFAVLVKLQTKNSNDVMVWQW